MDFRHRIDFSRVRTKAVFLPLCSSHISRSPSLTMRLVIPFGIHFSILTAVTSSTLVKRTDCAPYQDGAATWSANDYSIQDVTNTFLGKNLKDTRLWEQDLTLYRVGGDKSAFKEDIADYYNLKLFITKERRLSISTVPTIFRDKPKFRQFLYEVDAGKGGFHRYWSALHEGDQCWTPVDYSMWDVKSVHVRYKE